MSYTPRTRALIRLVDYFQQASTAQLAELVFPESLSRTTWDRILRAAVADGYLSRVEKRRRTGGARGGSGEYVYALGPEGWRLCKREGRFHGRAVDYHALAIVDAYMHLLRAERAGQFKINGFTPEPECHVTVDGQELKPDISVELERNGRVMVAWLELDMGTERPARIEEKIKRYVLAYRSGRVDPFPRVVFVAPDVERARELAWMIEKRPIEDRPLFKSLDLESFPQGL
jgi:hypothetical protein